MRVFLVEVLLAPNSPMSRKGRGLLERESFPGRNRVHILVAASGKVRKHQCIPGQLACELAGLRDGVARLDFGVDAQIVAPPAEDTADFSEFSSSFGASASAN